MAQSQLTVTLLAAKRNLGLSFADLGEMLGVDEVWVASLIYGQATALSFLRDYASLWHAIERCNSRKVWGWDYVCY